MTTITLMLPIHRPITIFSVSLLISDSISHYNFRFSILADYVSLLAVAYHISFFFSIQKSYHFLYKGYILFSFPRHWFPFRILLRFQIKITFILFSRSNMLVMHTKEYSSDKTKKECPHEVGKLMLNCNAYKGKLGKNLGM